MGNYTRKEYKQDNFHLGILNQYEWDSLDPSTQSQKGLQGLADAINVVIQKDEGGMVYKRRPFKFIDTANAQNSKIIPFQIQQGSINIGQFFCFTGNKDTKVINYNNKNFSVVQNITDVPYEIEQLPDLDWEFANGVLLLTHPKVPTQISYYNQNNPSLSNLVFNASNTVNTTNSYFGLFRGFEQIDPNLKIQVNAVSGGGQLVLLNATKYLFKVGDVLRIWYVVSPGAIQNQSVYPYLMDFKITSISAGGNQASYQVINGSDDFNQLILNGQIPSPPTGAPGTPSQSNVVCIPGLNYDNDFFLQNGIVQYPSAVTFSHDQRLLLLLADNIYGSEIGNFLNFYKGKLNTLNLPFQFAVYQKQISPGARIACLNEKIFILSGSEMTQYDYTGSTASYLSPTATRDVSFSNIKPKKIDVYMLGVSSCKRTLQLSFYIQNVDVITSESVLAYENDILDGNIIDCHVQKNPVLRIWLLLDSGTIIVMNVKTGPNFKPIPFGVTKFKHPNGKFVSISQANCSQGIPDHIIVGVLDNITKKLSYEVYDESIQYADNQNDIFLDRLVTFRNVIVNTISYVNEEYVLNVYGSTNLDGNTVTVVIRSLDGNKVEKIPDLIIANGSVKLTRENFLGFAGSVDIFVGTPYECLFSPVPFDYSRQGDVDYTNSMQKNITDSYLVLHKYTKFATNTNTNDGAKIAVGEYDSDNNMKIIEGYRNFTYKTTFQNINRINNVFENINKPIVFINNDEYFWSIRGLGYTSLLYKPDRKS